ncbi:hypothetical protein L6164_013745 [Bauhinia variegata]|uniref:Uncharacterized protein n=1 Tax=Bauhinia variegata TaxID=167791 RepID=A0ACB9NFB9_BAUVA|nr:hypothetical protein L6164_013745 [Bauhinia variegata]
MNLTQFLLVGGFSVSESTVAWSINSHAIPTFELAPLEQVQEVPSVQAINHQHLSGVTLTLLLPPKVACLLSLPNLGYLC